MKRVTKIAIIILVLDCIVQALPAAIAMLETNSYLPVHEQGLAKNFFKALSFNGVLYFFMAIPFYALFVFVYFSIARFVEKTMLWLTGIGMLDGLVLYSIYGTMLSHDSQADYFYYKLIWYGLIGGIFGFIHSRKIVLGSNSSLSSLDNTN